MKVSELLLLRVMDDNGKTVGHLLDFRCQTNPESNEADIREFVYGYGGLLERLGLKKITRERISWQAVQRIEKGTVVVSSIQT